MAAAGEPRGQHEHLSLAAAPRALGVQVEDVERPLQDGGTMQEAGDGIQSFAANGLRWRAARTARAWLEAEVIDALGTEPPLVPLKRSARRDVFALDLRAGPPLLLKRYPPRPGIVGRGRDLVVTRARSEFRM